MLLMHLLEADNYDFYFFVIKFAFVQDLGIRERGAAACYNTFSTQRTLNTRTIHAANKVLCSS